MSKPEREAETSNSTEKWRLNSYPVELRVEVGVVAFNPVEDFIEQSSASPDSYLSDEKPSNSIPQPEQDRPNPRLFQLL